MAFCSAAVASAHVSRTAPQRWRLLALRRAASLCASHFRALALGVALRNGSHASHTFDRQRNEAFTAHSALRLARAAPGPHLLVSYRPLAHAPALQSITRRREGQLFIGGLQKFASGLLLTAADGETPALHLWRPARATVRLALAAIIGARSRINCGTPPQKLALRCTRQKDGRPGHGPCFRRHAPRDKVPAQSRPRATC